MRYNFQDGPPEICDALTGIRTRNHAVSDAEHSPAGNCNYVPTFCRQLPGSNWYSHVPFPLPRDVTFDVLCQGCNAGYFVASSLWLSILLTICRRTNCSAPSKALTQPRCERGAAHHGVCTRVGTLIVATIYLQLIQNRYMFRSFPILQCSHQHCVQPVASDVEVVGYL